MASGLAIGLANCVLGKLGEIGEIAARAAWNEASLLLNFKNDFKWLEKKLRQISASLQAADEQSEQNKNVKEWLAVVRNIAFDAEDIIDECAVEHLYTNTTQSCVYNCSPLVFRYKMAKRIKELKERIRATIQEAQELKLFYDVSHLSQHSTSTSRSERREELNILEKDSPAVAVDYKVEEILRLLDNPAIRVVAVVGMGGLGKTFLLQHVFSRTKHRYDCSAWISVSQTYSLRKLQCDLASQIDLELASQISALDITDVRAAALIHDKLEGKRCLIVLDDIWTSSVEGDLISRLGLPTSRSNQCKIVVSTRSRNVAENINAHNYEMQHLSDGENWDLFCLFAFPEGNRPPEELERLAHQIVEECGRLPLAIKTVAASMAKSSLTEEWESKLGQLKKVRNAEDPILKILKLSYDALPPYLKSCFSYFSFFPEDTQISFMTFKRHSAIYHDYLIYLWIAEGFIPQEKNREQWDIGLDYLHQLENLCLLEVNRVSGCYTVHDLLLDLVVNICKENESEFHLPLNETRCRRLLLANKGLDTNAISERPLLCKRFLRTLSFSQNPDLTSFPEQLLDHVKLLRVIDLSRTAISTLPKCVGNLKVLKVLNLSRTEIKEVPDCVRRLKSLQFLDVSFCTSLQRVPDWIGELRSLSHLNVNWSLNLIHEGRMPKGISQLSSLRTLRSVSIPLSTEENGFLNIEDVGKLSDLLEIRFALEDVRTLKSVEDGILDHLVKMRVLVVKNAISTTDGDREGSSLPAFPENMKFMKGLQKLSIERFSVPSWICGMENLTELFLQECSDYPSLQKMPNLQKLILDSDSKCIELPKNFGESGGFPKLAKLVLRGCLLLEELPALEEGAMPRLEALLLENCPRVKRVPEGLERLRRLKQIEVVGEASGELEERLKEGGEDWNKIKANNPRVQIFFE